MEVKLSGNKLAQDKLKLLYILKYINTPLTDIEITNFVLDNNIMDYFTLQQLLSDLCDSNFIMQNSKNTIEYFSISEEGTAALDMFGEKLPDYFIKQVEQNFSTLKMEIKKNRELLGHYYKKQEDEFIVSLQVVENESTIFSLSINVPDEELAKNMCRKWDSNPEGIFSGIIKILTSDTP
jgi:predicted transcriptional regulator